MPGEVPDVATDFSKYTFDSDAIGPSSDTSEDVLTSSGTTAHLDLTNAGSGSTMGGGSGLDISGIVKTGVDAAVNITKTIGGLAVPPVPKLPTPPSVPQLPSTIPSLPSGPSQPATQPQPTQPAAPGGGSGTPSAAGTAQPGLSTGAKVAIGLGVGGLVVGGALVIASASKKRR